MTTRRLFDEDPRLVDFEARVTAIRPGDAGSIGPWIALDATAFYPEEGGQRPDRGVIADIPVSGLSLDVNGTIWHLLERDPGWKIGAIVAGHVDPAARRDHSQQHTGQHILSRAFVEILGAETRSFHMGEKTSTIDIDALEGEIGAAEIRDVEARANEVLFEDRSVVTSVESGPDPGPHGRPLRCVSVADFDEQHCCGTHVRRTGEIGMIKILRMERIRSLTRVQFVCGARALLAFQDAVESVDASSRVLSTAWGDLPDMVAGLMKSERDALRGIRDWQGRWAVLEADRLARATARRGDGTLRVVAWIDGANAETLRAAANAIISQDCAIAILAGPGEPGKRPWIVAGSSDLPDGSLDARETLREILGSLGGHGGGSKLFAQGSSPASDEASRAEIAALTASAE